MGEERKGIDRNFTRVMALVRFGFNIEETAERMGLRVEEVKAYMNKIPLYYEFLYEMGKNKKGSDYTKRAYELANMF